MRIKGVGSRENLTHNHHGRIQRLRCQRYFTAILAILFSSLFYHQIPKIGQSLKSSITRPKLGTMSMMSRLQSHTAGQPYTHIQFSYSLYNSYYIQCLWIRCPHNQCRLGTSSPSPSRCWVSPTKNCIYAPQTNLSPQTRDSRQSFTRRIQSHRCQSR